MTVRALLFSVCLVGMTSAIALAQAGDQTPAPSASPSTLATPQRTPAVMTPPTAAPAAEQPARVRNGQPVNIKVEVTITDQRATGAAPTKKTVSVVAADGMGGMIRTNATYAVLAEVPLNVDVEPQLLADGKIRLRLNLQYDLPMTGQPSASDPPVPQSIGTLRKTSIRENLSLVLENGKPLIAAQSADPVGDRQVTIEVKATVLR